MSEPTGMPRGPGRAHTVPSSCAYSIIDAIPARLFVTRPLHLLTGICSSPVPFGTNHSAGCFVRDGVPGCAYCEVLRETASPRKTTSLNARGSALDVPCITQRLLAVAAHCASRPSTASNEIQGLQF